MSSHREAPEISKDPVADSTDVYAFVSPDQTGTVTLIANYVPLEGPDGGPNFFEFGDDVRYSINIDNDGDGEADICYVFEFTSQLTNPNTFLYNTGPIRSLTDPNWNRRQVYDVTRVDFGSGIADRARSTSLGKGLACPPCNIGPLSTPNYPELANEAIHTLSGRGRSAGVVFAGQRAEGFYVDLGAVFDLGDLRPFEEFHNMYGLNSTGLGLMAAGINSTDTLNVHSIALQVPIAALTRSGRKPTGVTDPVAVIGVWTSASRRKVRVLSDHGPATYTGPWSQVSRLGNPLFNEVLIPLSRKDYWNRQQPAHDAQFVQYVIHPELAALLPSLYNNPIPVFPNLARYTKARADLKAILLTGIPNGVIPNATFTNFTGTVPADMLRLNMAIPPSSSPSNLGILGGDLAGFPNGRRVFDDVATIEVRAIAGATIPLVDPSFSPDLATGLVTFGLTASPSDTSAKGTEDYLPAFPYLGLPHSGFNAHTAAAVNGGLLSGVLTPASAQRSAGLPGSAPQPVPGSNGSQNGGGLRNLLQPSPGPSGNPSNGGLLGNLLQPSPEPTSGGLLGNLLK